MNEYIPTGPIITEVNSNSTKNIYCLNKFNPGNEWSEVELSGKSEIIHYNYSSYSNNEVKNNSVKMISFSGNPKYAGFTNFDPNDVEST